jgi:glycosyltransferase involved in cell wall biosynthesis
MKLPSITPLQLCQFTTKPRVLYVADVRNWSFDIKGREYRKYLPQYDIDIGYAHSALKNEPEYWENMLGWRKYDIIWHLHADNISRSDYLGHFVRQHNRQGRMVVLTQNNVLSVEEIRSEAKRYAAFNVLSVNNPWSYQNFLDAGFPNVYTCYDGVDLTTFGPDTPFHKRPFRVLFTSSKMRLEHKGYPIWQRVRELLKDRPDIEFEEVIADSFSNTSTPQQMNDIYNQCQVFACLSVSEGGPCTLLEGAACGLVPIMTRVGYSEYFENAIIIERDAEACAEKIVWLKDNPDLLLEMSRGISKEILDWSDRKMSQHWGYVLERAMILKKGLGTVAEKSR